MISPSIDRISPTREPRRRPVMRQKWRDLLFLHWPVPPDELRPLIPPPLELDLFDGQAYVGLVPFTMTGVRPVGLPPVLGLSTFHETNVRTYVHYQGENPGVWFFSLDAANRIAVALARRWFHLPYYHARMFHLRERRAPVEATSSYLSAGARAHAHPSPASYLIRAEARDGVGAATPGTLEHFLVERYLLYAESQGRIYRGQVHHSPYPVQAAKLITLDESLLAAAGIRRPEQPPLAHASSGVDVNVYALERVIG